MSDAPVLPCLFTTVGTLAHACHFCTGTGADACHNCTGPGLATAMAASGLNERQRRSVSDRWFLPWSKNSVRPQAVVLRGGIDGVAKPNKHVLAWQSKASAPPRFDSKGFGSPT